MNRREFLETTLTASAGLALSATSQAQEGKRPTIITTWNFGIPANEIAWKTLMEGKSVVDAVEAGVRLVESDPQYDSVGLGGLPNRDGVVQLDAHIQDGRTGRAGGVCALEFIENPISVARKVMEQTPHVLLAGAGALEFALAQGFKKTNLLTERSVRRWQEWKRRQSSDYAPPPVTWPQYHDTIGMCALDASGNLAVACSTSGLAWKIPGRVGDSPICGAGSYCDNSVGAACSTGMGEEVLQTGGSFLVVELMRQGRSPEAACKEACQRVIARAARASKFTRTEIKPEGVMYLALRRDGVFGAYSILGGGEFAVHNGENKLYQAKKLLGD